MILVILPDSADVDTTLPESVNKTTQVNRDILEILFFIEQYYRRLWVRSKGENGAVLPEAASRKHTADMPKAYQ
jgi:hypothetical protein